jgi:glutathione S-transferase
MELYSIDWSPWVRKVRIAAIERGIDNNIKLLPADIGFADKTLKIVESNLSTLNPSGRVPTLITDDGQSIYDSTVIVHYLDTIGEEFSIIPKDNGKKINCLKINALVDEIIDSLRHISLENRREENKRLSDWLDALDKKVRRGIEVIETYINFLSLSNTQVLNLADISIIILLGTIKRNPKSNYDIFSDNLNDWFNQMSERESVKRTKPPYL